MAHSKGQLTGRQSAFAIHYAATKDATYAAAKAGYAFPEMAGSRLINETSEVTAEANKIYVRTMLSEILPKCLRRLNETLDTQPPGPTLNQAIKLGLTASVEIIKSVGDTSQSDDQLDPVELARKVREGEILLDRLSNHYRFLLEHDPNEPGVAPAKEPGLFD